MQQGITNTTVFRLLSTVFNFLIALLLSRFLGTKVKGDATIILTTITFLVFFCSFVGGQALVYLVPRYKVENLVIPAYIWTLLVAGVAYILLRHFHVFTWRRTLNICALSILNALVNIHAAVLLAKQRIKQYNVVTLLPVLLTFIGLLLCIFVYKYDSIYAYVYPLYAAYILAAVVSFGYCVRYIGLGSVTGIFDDMDSSLKYGAGFQTFDLLQLLNFRLYFYLLYYLQGASDLGLYSIGVSVLEVAWVFGRSVSVIHYSDFSNHQNEKMAVRQTLRYLKVVFVAAALFLLIVALCPVQMYGFVFGASFTYVKYTVKWLFPGVLMYSIALVIQSVYLSRASYGRLIFAQLTALLSSLVLCYLLIPTYYFSGASAAASVSYVICALIMLFFFVKDHNIALSQLLISKADVDFINNVLKSYLQRGKDS